MTILDQLRSFFSSQECSAFLVGGYLRDSMLSVPPERDLDIAVAGDPQLLGPGLASVLGGTYVALGPTHRVGRVVVASSDGDDEEPDVEGAWTIDLRGFSGSIEEELGNRDFTINALALPLEIADIQVGTAALDESVVDPYNGRQDMARKCIRAVGANVFQDDPARLLRAVRLAARLRFRLDPETTRMVVAEAPLISRVSGDRVRNEFLSILALNGARGHLEVLDHLDLLCRIFPELSAAKGVEQPREHYWDVWGHLMHSVECAELVTKGHQNSPVYSFVPWAAEREDYFNLQISDGHNRRTILKLAALMHDIAKPQTKKTDETGRTRFPGHSELGAEIAKARLAQLRLSSRGIDAVAKLVLEHLRPATMQQGVELPTSRAVYRYFRDLGDVAIDSLYLWMADHLAAKGPELVTDAWAAHARMVAYILQLGAQPPDSPHKSRLVTGHDLMEQLQLGPGPVIGRLMDRIHEAQATGEVASREDAIALAQETLNQCNETEGG